MRKKSMDMDWDEVPVVVDIDFVQWLLGISRETVRLDIHSGRLPAFRIGGIWRINKSDLIAYASE